MAHPIVGFNLVLFIIWIWTALCISNVIRIGMFVLTTESKVLLCDFHREKAWVEWTTRKDNVCHEEVLPLLRSIADSPTEEEFAQRLLLLQHTKAWQENEKLRRWFSNKWLPQTKVSISPCCYGKTNFYFALFSHQWVPFWNTASLTFERSEHLQLLSFLNQRWVRVFRGESLRVTIYTNNGIEGQNETLKHTYLEGYKNCSQGLTQSQGLTLMLVSLSERTGFFEGASVGLFYLPGWTSSLINTSVK